MTDILIEAFTTSLAVLPWWTMKGSGDYDHEEDETTTEWIFRIALGLMLLLLAGGIIYLIWIHD